METIFGDDLPLHELPKLGERLGRGGKARENFLQGLPGYRKRGRKDELFGNLRERTEVVLEGPPQRAFEVEGRPITEQETEGGWVLVVREVTREREIQERVQRQDRLAAVGQLAAGIAQLPEASVTADLCLDGLGEFLNVLAGNAMSGIQATGVECRLEAPRYGQSPQQGWWFEIASNWGKAALVLNED